MRVDYAVGVLLEGDVAADAIVQFDRWFREAEKAQIREPNAMTLATADADGRPSARVVLLKDFDHRGFTFYTNYYSRKGGDLAVNPRASLVFFWSTLERQIRIDGTVESVDRAESEAYFQSRPRQSQLGAWASRQSEPVKSRDVFEQRFAELERQFPDRVPLPDFWGGYRVRPIAIEFWQGRRSRLHDRLVYLKSGEHWKIERLSP